MTRTGGHVQRPQTEHVMFGTGPWEMAFWKRQAVMTTAERSRQGQVCLGDRESASLGGPVCSYRGMVGEVTRKKK